MQEAGGNSGEQAAFAMLLLFSGPTGDVGGRSEGALLLTRGSPL